MRVILDTNFLIYCAKNKLDYAEEISNLLNEDYELVLPLQVFRELELLRDDKKKKVSGKDKRAIDLALQLLGVNNVKKIKVKEIIKICKGKTEAENSEPKILGIKSGAKAIIPAEIGKPIIIKYFIDFSKVLASFSLLFIKYSLIAGKSAATKAKGIK